MNIDIQENWNNMKNASDTLSPTAYAIATAIVVPVCAGALLSAAGLCLAAWPVLPVLAYLQRKEELAKAKAEAQKPQQDPQPES